MTATASIPSTMLVGDDERRYLAELQKILRAARLNTYYPDARALASHLRVMAPHVHKGLYPGVDVDTRSGLPTYREWTRVQTDVTLAAEALARLGELDELRVKASSGNPAHVRLLKKYEYYAAVRGKALVPLGDMNARLRRVDGHMAYYNITLDKLDVSGLFVRYTIDCSQPLGDNAAATLGENEVAQHTESFRSLLYRFTALDAELTLIKLATLGGLQVERVVKGTVGPFFFPWSRDVPVAFETLVQTAGYVATFGLDHVASDVQADRNNDPFSPNHDHRLSAEARRGRAETKERLGYHGFQDRKFVVPRPALSELRHTLGELGARNIVYGALAVH